MKLKKIDAVEIAVKALYEEVLGPADKDSRRYLTADTSKSVQAYGRVLKIIESVKNEQPALISMEISPEFKSLLKGIKADGE